MNIKKKGIIFTVIATLIFGITPVIGKMTYAMGSNGIQLAFLRHLFVVPLFLFIVVYQKLSLRLTKQQYLDVFKVGFFGNTLTVVMLYMSYSYIPVGSATVLHFLYPLFVCLFNFLFYKQTLNQKQMLCLALAIVGVFCFIDNTSSSMIGFVLAVTSGIFFAYYMIGMDHSSIRNISPYVFNFYLVIMNTVVIFLLGLLTKSLSIMPIEGYICYRCYFCIVSGCGAFTIRNSLLRSFFNSDFINFRTYYKYCYWLSIFGRNSNCFKNNRMFISTSFYFYTCEKSNCCRRIKMTIEQLITKLQEKDRFILAIDGMCGSGKSTLALELAHIFNAHVFCMDDFFLPQELRTLERYHMPGGNVHYERFLETVLKPLSEYKTIHYQPFDCTKMKLISDIQEIPYTPYNIIEGSYALRPELVPYYTDIIVLKITQQQQIERLTNRNPEKVSTFIEQWIPLENQYFEYSCRCF